MGLCPLVMFRDDPKLEAFGLTLYMHWKRGILPSTGGLDDQPANYEAIIMSIDYGTNTAKTVLREKEEAKAKKPPKGAGPRHTKRR